MKSRIFEVGFALALASAPLAAAQPEGIQPITAKDLCHGCQIWVAKYPGPKAQIVLKSGIVQKFCSVQCMLCAVHREGERSDRKGIYVQDAGKVDWNNPGDNEYINALDAWYVGGVACRAGKGKTFAASLDRNAVEELQKEHGGRVVTYGEIKNDFLECLPYRNPSLPTFRDGPGGGFAAHGMKRD